MAGEQSFYSVLLTDMDIAEPTIKLNWTRRNSNRTDLTIRRDSTGNTDIITFQNIASPTGGQSIIRLTAEQRSTILSAMSTVQELDVEFAMKTMAGSSVMGTVVQTATLRTTAENSAPIFTGFTYYDSSGQSELITGDRTRIIQNLSSMYIDCTAGTARNEATLVRYEATLGTKTGGRNAPNTRILFGTTSAVGECELSVSLTDSRGYSTTVTATLDILPYSPIAINSYKFRRINYVEAETILEFSGYYSLLTVDGVDKNALASVDYRYKELPSGDWSDDTPISGVTSGSGALSFTANPWASFSADKSYEFEFLFMDTVGTETVLSLTLGKASALMSMREEGVGIFNNAPQRALDVNGNIGMNGYNVLGIVREIGDDEDLNSVKESGIYTRFVTNGTPTDNFPVNSKGILEVVGTTDNLVQRFTDIINNNVYCRTYYLVSGTSHAWMQWKQL